MAIMQWGTPPPDREIAVKRGNYDAWGENAARTDSLHGEPMFKAYEREGIAPAGRYNGYAETEAQKAAEKKPPTRSPKRERRCHAEEDTCMGWARHDTGYCYGHSVSMGLKQHGGYKDGKWQKAADE